MATLVFHRLRQLMLLIFVTVSLTATAFAHRMPALDDGALALALSNGLTLADLCATDSAGDEPRAEHCLACQTSAMTGLPANVAALVDLDLAFVLQVPAPRESRAFARILNPAHGPQAPPTA